MEIRLARKPTLPDGRTTFGAVFVDGQFECFSLEDAVREVPGRPVKEWKVAGATAIPAGRYRVTIEPSPRFKRPLPRLHGVPGFSGILIHPGNGHRDTDGCILLGRQRVKDRVLESAAACAQFESKLRQAAAAGKEAWITIENPPAIQPAVKTGV